MRQSHTTHVRPVVWAAGCLLIAACASPVDRAPDERLGVGSTAPSDVWASHGSDSGGTRFSTANQITRANVADLKPAWTYRTGDLIEGRTRFQATPLLIDGVLFISTPFGRVVALDAVQGFERWSFDPGIDVLASYGDYANRGVAYWRDPDARPADTVCRERIYVAPIDARLISLDAATGMPCTGFGSAGSVDLRTGLPNESHGSEYQTTSPPIITANLVIVGSAVADNQRTDAPSGLVRAFDARSGDLQWSWDPVPRQDTDATAGEWRGERARATGAANVWTVMSSDPERDLVFLPTSSPSPDFYGGERLGDNRSANSLVALRASTGELVWSFQAVHHDVWDYDLPAQPVLASIRREGIDVPVVVQASKMGFVYVLHRETGEPMFPIEERPVPPSDVPGETVSATQPFPTRPQPLVPIRFDSPWGVTPDDQAWCDALYGPRRNEGIFTPPSLEGSILYPGNLGGSNWSGMAFDSSRGILVVPTNRMSTIVQLIPQAEADAVTDTLRAEGWEVSRQRGTPYYMARTFPLSPSGLPCDPPPWGTLTAIDLSTGDRRWETPLGRMPGTEPIPESADWGSINLGGPVVTETGLVFIAGSLDAHLRAFDVETGDELWAGALPAGGHATPMTYAIAGRQFVVIAAGGHGRLPSPPGDYLVAFALPLTSETATPAPTPAGLAGEYSGYLRIEGLQFDVTVTLIASAEERDPTMTGTMTVPGLAIEASMTGLVTLDGLSLDVPFTSGTLECSGDLRGELVAPGPEGRLAGAIRTSGECSDSEPEAGRLMIERTIASSPSQDGA